MAGGKMGASETMKGISKIMEKIKNPKETAKIDRWQGKLDNARLAYTGELNKMKELYRVYQGDRHVMGNPNKNKAPEKVANNVWNIVYELIESQVDSSIPVPKVTPLHSGDEELAKVIEKILIAEVKRIRFTKMNDFQERTTPIRGGDFFHVEWDDAAGSHCTLGDLSVKRRSAIQIIPQPGVTELEDMDYIFLQISMTKDAVQRKYGVDVKFADEERPELRNEDTAAAYAQELVTVNVAYYRNRDGGIGRFTWCDAYMLEDLEDYQSRMVEVCAKCGLPKNGEVCSCGSRKFKREKQDKELLHQDISIGSGETIPAYTQNEIPAVDEEGNPVIGEDGVPVMETEVMQNSIPYYKPNMFPFVIRRNVSSEGDFLGFSDAEIIQDQQDTVKKLGSKINEKLLKGGSFVTMPEDVAVETDGEELNILRLSSPNQKQQIDVITIQPDITKDRAVEEANYQHAKSVLGITDSFQGKYDASATSGSAKQYQINQAAGRLESKRVMKNTAYSELYELMFKFLLAYADQPIEFSTKNEHGVLEFAHFDRMMFLKRDAAGELYWNDEFLFETDPTSTILTNREAMWQQADLKLQSGAFGPLTELKTLQLYWLFMEKNNYPNAGEIRSVIEARLQEEEAMKQMVQQQAVNGGAEGEMPVM